MNVWTVLPILLAVAAMVALWRLLNPPPLLVIGDRGILDRRLGVGWIPWDQVEGAYPPAAGDHDSVRLRLKPHRRLARRLRRRLRVPDPSRAVEIELELAGTHLSAIEILREVMSHGRALAGGAGGHHPCSAS